MMKITEIQMDMAFASPSENFDKAEKLIADAMKEKPDVITLPETWNTGFFPHDNLCGLADNDCETVRKRIGSLAEKYSVNIVAGSVANNRDGRVYNTCCVFDRSGSCIAQYDKTHLFTPMGEHDFFEKGEKVCRFSLDGIECGVIICYDIRFPELTRTLTVKGLDVLFVVSQWPQVRIPHLVTLARARAIENQMFVSVTNSCGKAPGTVYGGTSVVFDPWGECLAEAGADETLLSAECDMSIIKGIRESINVFADRRPTLYDIE